MKNIAPILLCLLIIGAGCKKKFLDVPLQGQGTSSNDPQVILGEVTGAYNALITPDPTQPGFGDYDVHGVYFITVTNIMSDDADKGSYASDQALAAAIDNFTLTSDNTYVAGLWRGYYAGISRTNIAIQDLPKATSVLTASMITTRIAEMRFLRAYFYFNLTRMFGGVPLVLTVPTGPTNQDSTFFIRATVADVYNKAIIPDLQFAATNLPLKSATDVGRATKGAAEALLAKVYMYQTPANWQKVDSLTQDVIISGQYGLIPDYSILWRQAGDNSNESIFEVETGIYGNADYGIPEYVEAQGPRQDNGMGTPTTPWNNPGFYQPSGDDGYGLCMPSANLVAAYEPGDKRKAATIIELPVNSPPDTLFDGFLVPSMTGPGAYQSTVYYNYKAYHSKILPGGSKPQIEAFVSDRGKCPKNVHLLRYADVLLMKAEAATQLGGDVATPLNMVRHRAGLGNAPSLTQQAVWNERRVELAMEHDRFWDIVRQGRAAQVMHAAGKANFVAGKHELLPIPSSEIGVSGGRLTQNPGYQ